MMKRKMVANEARLWITRFKGEFGEAVRCHSGSFVKSSTLVAFGIRYGAAEKGRMDIINYIRAFCVLNSIGS
jgi:hypothetical protein